LDAARLRPLLVALALLAAPLTGPAPVRAQPQPLPAGMQVTWELFRTALKQDNPAALARVSKFPIVSNEFGGSIESPAVLRRRYPWIFTPKLKACLLATTPVLEPVGGIATYEAFCDNDRYPLRFLFQEVQGAFRLVTIDNINE
jgi:hypothetical protein